MSREYTPDGTGSYTGEACPHCGAQTFIFAGETPDCLRCFTMNETALMCREHIDGGLSALLKIVRDLPPDTKRNLHRDLLAFRVNLEQCVAATS